MKMNRYLIFENGKYAGSFMAPHAPEAVDGVEYRDAPEDYSPEVEYILEGADENPEEAAGEEIDGASGGLFDRVKRLLT